MKALTYTVLAALLFCACSSTPESESIKDTITRATAESIENSLPSLKGKYSTLIDTLGWFRCQGAMMESARGDSREFGIEQVSPTRDECNTGSGKILLTKLLYRNASGIPVNMIIDEMDVKLDTTSWYSTMTCKVKGTSKLETLLVHYIRGKEKTEVNQMWRVDAGKTSFLKVVNPGIFECIEEETCLH